MRPAEAALEEAARRELRSAWGGGEAAASASAPGRCTIVGEHVDYAGGLVLCAAIDLHVAAAVRVSADGVDRAAGDGEHVLAAATALRRRGVAVPAVEVATAATLPPGAGLASSAAVICAVLVSLLRLTGGRMRASELIDTAFGAEHDVLGVPCGRLDQHAVVEAPARGALLLDCSDDTTSRVLWPWDDVVLCVCDTGERHRVGGPEYALRRAEAADALRRAGVSCAQELDAATLPRLERTLDPVQRRRLRHVVTESARSAAAADALRGADAATLGRLMSESHRSLRDDCEVTTPALDRTAAAAAATPGCLGARMVGAGFGGAVVALVAESAAAGCRAAMERAAARDARSWIVQPAAGVATTQAGIIVAG